MRRYSLAFGAILGGLTTLPLIALFYLGSQIAGLRFVPFDVFEWLSRVLPGRIVIVAIESMVTLIRAFNLGPTAGVAKAAEQLQAIGLAIAIGVIVGAAMGWVLHGGQRPGWLVGFSFGLLLALFNLVAAASLGLEQGDWVSITWMVLLTAGWGALLGWMLGMRGAGTEPSAAGTGTVSRRSILAKAGGVSLATALISWGLARTLEAGRPSASLAPPPILPTPVPPAAPGAQPTVVAHAQTPTVPVARIQPAPGTRPELTANADFYRIDINLIPPDVKEASWVLKTGGLFDRTPPLMLGNLKRYPEVSQIVTQCCISNPVGGDLIGTTKWTGLRLVDLLQDLGLRSGAKALALEAADGYVEYVQTADMMDPRTMLVYAMNGDPLPIEHGFPLRIFIPNRFGMKQPKWITSLTAVDQDQDGYWVQRGWNKQARPQIQSVIDPIDPTSRPDGRVAIGGIAWAGDRGILKVEVQTDGGAWQAANLRVPPLSAFAWVQWRYDWPRVAGSHTFRVRATDGTGALQTEQNTDTYPDGATGYHEMKMTF